MSIKVIAFDLDRTLTQHKTPISREHTEILHRLSKNVSSSWWERVCAEEYMTK